MAVETKVRMRRLARVGPLKRAGALLVAAACASAKVAPVRDACAGAGGVSVLHHDVDLALTLAPPSLAGTANVKLRATRDTPAISLDARGLAIDSVTSEGAALQFSNDGKRLCVERPLRAGREVTVTVHYLASTKRATPAFFADQAYAGYQTSAWLPTVQDAAQRATLTLRITTAADLRVAASGRALPDEALPDGRVRHSFSLERASPPFLFAFAAGRFAEASLDVDGVHLVALGPAGAELSNALAATAPMLRFLVVHAGAPFPAATYTQAFVHGDAMQEAAGISLETDEALADLKADPSDDWLLAHELSHQWFAWLVPCADFADFWLNEGFATFLTAAVKEARWGRAAYDREVTLWRERSAKVHAAGKDAPLALASAPANEAALQPRGVTYSRGALVLHRLRTELGDAAFWDGVGRYTRARAGVGARSADLRAALEAASGRDLGPLFDAWVYRATPDL